MIEQPAFGRRLRQVRVQRGMSQSELANAEVSASYVSLVESGRRLPNDMLAELFARRLDVPLENLTAPQDPAEHRSRRLDLTGRLLVARALRKDGELEAAAEQLRGLEAEAAGHSDEDVLWESSWELATVLHALGHLEEQQRVLVALLDNVLTQEAPRLAARVGAALAENLRRQGRPGEAVRSAEAAVAVTVTLPPASPERVAALVALLAAYTDSSEPANAVTLAGTLEALAEEIPAQQLRGRVYWALGGAWFLAGEPERAVALHDRAFACLRPEADLPAWARLCLTSAVLRLENDPSDAAAEAAGALLRRARQALELVGRPGDLRELMLGEAQLALREEKADEVLALTSRVLESAGELPLPERGTCLLVAARAHVLAGDLPAAQSGYRLAAQAMEQAGAYRKSAQAWRELSELLAGGAPGH
ncbi:helix-turn-helix transcriptional regulator [Streptomyces sp. NPDC089922]|uniref:helix-turn-helix transcriptional regulator n=1 Tax=unclassified Streptomyces TaxID=2593676 RepID=UPI00343F35B4